MVSQALQGLLEQLIRKNKNTNKKSQETCDHCENFVVVFTQIDRLCHTIIFFQQHFNTEIDYTLTAQQ